MGEQDAQFYIYIYVYLYNTFHSLTDFAEKSLLTKSVHLIIPYFQDW
jgi:hypothetical protein